MFFLLYNIIISNNDNNIYLYTTDGFIQHSQKDIIIKYGQIFTGYIIMNWLKFNKNNNYIDIWIKDEEILVFIMMIALMIIKYYMESSSELIMVILSKECNKYGLLLRDLMIALSDKIKSKNHKSIQLRVLLSNSSNSEIKKPHFDRETNII